MLVAMDFMASSTQPLPRAERKPLFGAALVVASRKEKRVRYKGFADTAPECPSAIKVPGTEDTHPSWDIDILEGREINEMELVVDITFMMIDDPEPWPEWVTALRQVD